MIHTILILATVQSSAFLDEFAGVSDSVRQVATFIRSVDQPSVPEAKLGSEARSYSEQWMDRVLSPALRESARKAPWTGASSADGVSKMFVKSWNSKLGSVTWSDNGVFAVLRVRVGKPEVLDSSESANRFVENQLTTLLALPKQKNVRSYLRQGTRTTALGYEGNVMRGLRTESHTLSDGQIVEKVLDPLTWSNVLYVVSNGAEFVVRLNFYGEAQEVASKMADPRNRF